LRVLIFGTVFAATEEQAELARLWGHMHSVLNQECDLLLVDSDSPHLIADDFAPVIQLGDNIGHLSRGGADGWGRAFCTVLNYAIDRRYDYVVHIEGDSLCSLDVARVCRTMSDHDLCAVGVPARGLQREEKGWIETGLMFMDVDYLEDNRIVQQYRWQDHSYKNYPQTPEFWLKQLFGSNLRMKNNWRTLRDDCGILTVDSVRNYDWITHSTPEIYAAFSEYALEDA